MSTQENKASIKRLIEEGMNNGNASAIDELIAPNYVSADAGMSAAGPEGFKALVASFRTAFPDSHLEIEDMVAEGDKVITWAVFTGTHNGLLEGLAPTGRQVRVKDIDLWRLENGKVVETRAHFDQLGMLQQLGVLGAMSEKEA